MKSLGIIETLGLAAGIEAADVAVKSANVELVGYELTRGGGMVAVKILGDVGAVKAAVDAAKSAVPNVSAVVADIVIPRPSDGITNMVFSDQTVGYTPEPAKKAPAKKAPAKKAPAKKPAAKPAEKPAPAKPAAKEETPKAEPSTSASKSNDDASKAAPAKKVSPSEKDNNAKSSDATSESKNSATNDKKDQS